MSLDILPLEIQGGEMEQFSFCKVTLPRAARRGGTGLKDCNLWSPLPAVLTGFSACPTVVLTSAFEGPSAAGVPVLPWLLVGSGASAPSAYCREGR